MRLLVTIDCANDAFVSNPLGLQGEVAEVLWRLADQVLDDMQPSHLLVGSSHPLRDTNGNTVGEARWVLDEDDVPPGYERVPPDEIMGFRDGSPIRAHPESTSLRPKVQATEPPNEGSTT